MNSPNPPNPANPESEPAQVPPPDDGLRRLLTWTFIALGVTLLLTAIGVTLAVYWFDSIPNS